MAKSDMSPEAYAEFVAGRFDEAERSATPIVFSNRGTFHAKTVLAHMVTRARNSLDIFSGCLSAKVYDVALLKAAAINLNGKMRVIVAERSPYSKTSALDMLSAEIDSGLIAVRTVHKNLSMHNIAVNHFAMCDQKHIRAENDAVDRSATIILNATSGNALEVTRSLNRIFDQMWHLSEETSIVLPA